MDNKYNLKFIFPNIERFSESNPDLLGYLEVPKYIGTPSTAIPILAALTPDKYNITFTDQRLEEINYDEKVDLAAISVYTPQAEYAFKIGDEYRKRGVKVVMGGMFPSVMPEETGKHADSVVIGEAEPVWAQLLSDFENNSLKPLYKPETFFDLANFPMPRYDLLFEKEKLGYSKIDYPLQTSRGCPISCVNCVVPNFMGNKFRYKPIEKLEQELEIIFSDPERQIFLSEDQMFLSIHFEQGQEHFDQLHALFKARKWKMSYYALNVPFIKSRPNDLLKLKEMGLNRIYLILGYEKFSARLFSKDATAKDLQDILDLCKKIFDMGLEIYPGIFIGLDSHDDGTADKILNFLNKAGMRIAEFTMVTPYPGTPLWNQMITENRILHRNWTKYNDANVVFQPKLMSAESLLESYKRLWREFYKEKKDIKDKEGYRYVQF